MRIIGPHSASYSMVYSRIVVRAEVNDRFIDEMFPALWNAATKYAIDGVGMVAQAAKETKWGNFGGKVTPEFYNTAGIKIRHIGFIPGVNDGDKPLAHSLFANWETGAEAHAQHLRAYTGTDVTGLIVDPRYYLAVKAPNLIVEWSDLNGKWAPSPTYGTEIEAIMRTLL